MAYKLGVRGWVRSTRWGTVMGQIQGDREQVDQMAMWLRLQGSPGSRVHRCDFRNWMMLDSRDFRNFSVRF
ncbi:Acylphosphatase [Cordylochernes scorpioides]|nr:Acylphosphatase [Cordylochernes scorpioides]